MGFRSGGPVGRLENVPVSIAHMDVGRMLLVGVR